MKVMDFDKLAGISQSIATSSALNPSLLLCLIATPIGTIGAILLKSTPLMPWFVAMALAPPALTFCQILFFTIWDRDRLHNEKHIEQKMMIERAPPSLGDKSRVVEIDAGLELESNPMLEGKASV